MRPTIPSASPASGYEVRGQRISMIASDVFLGWQRSLGLDGEEHDFYVRQPWD